MVREKDISILRSQFVTSSYDNIFDTSKHGGRRYLPYVFTDLSKIEIKKLDISHDRFLIIVNNDVYHIAASLKDLGKKWFLKESASTRVFLGWRLGVLE